MIKQLLVCMALSSSPTCGMQQFSPHSSAGSLPITADQQLLQELGIKIGPNDTKTIAAKQVLLGMENLIKNKGPNISEAEQVVLLLKMVNLILPGKPLEIGN